jgi:prepilin-type processing-associated H-X9-DG protein
MLLPALSKAKERARGIKCLSNTKQLTLGWITYQNDSQDNLMDPTKAIDQGLNYMIWGNDSRATNISGLVGDTALMAPYVRAPGVYKCASDNYQSPSSAGERTRSVAMNGALGGGPSFINSSPSPGLNFFSAKKAQDLIRPGPSRIFVFLDEQADSLDDLLFMNNPGYAPGSELWRNLPAAYHDGAGSFSFADGHSEIHKWLEHGKPPRTPQTIWPITFVNYPTTTPPWGVAQPANRDYEWVEGGQPFR